MGDCAEIGGEKDTTLFLGRALWKSIERHCFILIIFNWDTLFESSMEIDQMFTVNMPKLFAHRQKGFILLKRGFRDCER